MRRTLITLEELLQDYRCDHIIADHCGARDFAKTLMLADVVKMCQRVCCIGCEDRNMCGYNCSLADDTVRELKKIVEEMNSNVEGSG